ncbi:hypothetical protein PDE_00641 [Penicillium oxalicum 114-2]|uniref:Uncharacterized protein n=1 Tax=Penicillium oxalicum (strain 114-2 / CGMCC 5302) TaxID=933388 RepID=S8AV22_PENO1|nr:hypothetical protein PDE_00641 [Penicillium oxalicum 114-2]
MMKGCLQVEQPATGNKNERIDAETAEDQTLQDKRSRKGGSMWLRHLEHLKDLLSTDFTSAVKPAEDTTHE